MKNLLFLIVIFVIQSCSNDDKTNYTITEQTISINNSENFEYDLGYFGDEEGANIYTQAEHFEISELNRNEYQQIIYTYKTQDGFTGADFVEIRKSGYNINTGKTIIYEAIKLTINVSE